MNYINTGSHFFCSTVNRMIKNIFKFKINIDICLSKRERKKRKRKSIISCIYYLLCDKIQTILHIIGVCALKQRESSGKFSIGFVPSFFSTQYLCFQTQIPPFFPSENDEKDSNVSDNKIKC